MSHLKLSHVLGRVDELRTAVAAAKDRGFECVYRANPATVYNAFIWVEIGPFLEFFVMPPMDEASLGAAEAAVSGPETAARLRQLSATGRAGAALSWRQTLGTSTRSSEGSHAMAFRSA